MKIWEDFNCKVHQHHDYRGPYWRRICTMDVRIILMPKRELPPTIKENEARSPRKLFVVTWITKIQCIPHSAFQKVESQGNCEKTDSTVQETPEPWLVRKSIWERVEEFDPFSEVSKELITSMGNTEFFYLCEIFSKIQCPDCVFILGSWHRKQHLRQKRAVVGKESTAEQSQIRRLVNLWLNMTFCPSPVLSSFERSPRLDPEMGHFCDNTYATKNTGNAEESPHTRWRKYPGTNDITIRNAANLCLIFGWNKEYDKIELKYQSHTAERNQNEKSWKLSLNAQIAQGLLNQRSDWLCKYEANMQKMYHEFSATPIFPTNSLRVF